MKLQLRYPLLTALAGLLASTPTLAQGTTPAVEPRQQALGDLECRTLLRLSGEERDFTVLYLHGFVSGRMNQMQPQVKGLSEATDKLIDRCIDKPSEKALVVLESLRGAGK